jgi:hypothetical protein
MKPQRKMQGKDARSARRAEQAYLAREAIQRCQVCGRLFTRHAKDRVCSRDCLAKLEQQAKQAPAPAQS